MDPGTPFGAQDDGVFPSLSSLLLEHPSRRRFAAPQDEGSGDETAPDAQAVATEAQAPDTD